MPVGAPWGAGLAGAQPHPVPSPLCVSEPQVLMPEEEPLSWKTRAINLSLSNLIKMLAH